MDRRRRLDELLSQLLQPDADRHAIDQAAWSDLGQQRGVIFTDMADFTSRVHRQGLLHYLALIKRSRGIVEHVLGRYTGVFLKEEADSFLLLLPDASSALACGLAIVERHRAYNESVQPDQQLSISMGIGFGDVILVEDDVFGLEVNLASKLGEDCARPWEILVTRTCYEALEPASQGLLDPAPEVTFGTLTIPCFRARLPMP